MFHILRIFDSFLEGLFFLAGHLNQDFTINVAVQRTLMQKSCGLFRCGLEDPPQPIADSDVTAEVSTEGWQLSCIGF